MIGSLRHLAKHSAIYASGDILAKFVGFLLLPLYSRKFSAYDYGILALIQILNTIPSRLATQGIMTWGLKAITVDYADDPHRRRVSITTAHFYLIFSSLVVNGCLLLAIPLLSRFVMKSDDYNYLLACAFTASIFETARMIPFNVILRARFRSVLYTVLSFSQFVASVSLNIWFVVFLDSGIAGIIYTDLIIAVCMGVVSFVIIWPDLVPIFSWAEVRRMVGYGWPLVPAKISMWLLDFADRFQLQQLSTTVEVGLYAVGAKYAKIFQLFFLTQFEKVWPSIFFPLSARKDAGPQFARLFTYVFLIGCGMGLAVILFVEPLVQLTLEESYWRASRVVVWLVAGFILEATYQVFTVGVRVTSQTRYMPVIVGAGAAFNILANLWILPRWGMVGAGFTTLCANGVLVILGYRYSNRYFPVPFEWGRLARIGVLFVAIAALDGFGSPDRLMLALPFKVAELLCFPLGLWVGGVVSRRELEPIREILKNIKVKGSKLVGRGKTAESETRVK